MIVDTSRPITAKSCNDAILNIVKTYPFCRSELLTNTVFQRPIRTLVIGNGPRKVLYSASHHANEWITSLLLLKFIEDLAQTVGGGDPDAPQRQGNGRSRAPAPTLQEVTLYAVPMVDPDGVDLVVGAIPEDSVQYTLARDLSQNYPAIPFPDGWKANLLGVDLNLQYPAGWLQARQIKFSQGFTLPGPRDFVGRAPLDQAETKALAGYTEAVNPDLVIALHTQGEEIYWQFEDIFIPGARELGEKFAQVSGYTLADTPYNSAFAGYKDWFIKYFRRPGYTIEAGKGENPLPIEDFPSIYEKVAPILLTGLTYTSPRGREF
ncbi:MAG: M14 family metallocarboxypeptidase [Oscillospiraceae bacterium]|nr:M14 family metallocarboxypeptidase [Oscillospiraceae bacterium]